MSDFVKKIKGFLDNNDYEALTEQEKLDPEVLYMTSEPDEGVANAVTVEASNFSNLLSTNATNVQKALEEIDQSMIAIDGVDILNLF